MKTEGTSATGSTRGVRAELGSDDDADGVGDGDDSEGDGCVARGDMVMRGGIDKGRRRTLEKGLTLDSR